MTRALLLGIVRNSLSIGISFIAYHHNDACSNKMNTVIIPFLSTIYQYFFLINEWLSQCNIICCTMMTGWTMHNILHKKRHDKIVGYFDARVKRKRYAFTRSFIPMTRRGDCGQSTGTGAIQIGWGDKFLLLQTRW